jgi:Phospholipase_D-nuclease N-terminal
MRETIIRFLTLNPLNEHPLVYWGLGFIWVILILNCLASLRQQPTGYKARWTWFALILFLPIIGMGLYLMRCLVTADYSFLKFVVGPPKKIQRQLAK